VKCFPMLSGKQFQRDREIFAVLPPAQ
jgi:hypothetical protein